MTAIALEKPDSIFTTPRGRDECVGESGYSIDTGERKPQYRWSFTLGQAIITTPEASAEGDEWIRKVLPLLDRVAALSNDWDAEGSPRPDPKTVAAARQLLVQLAASSDTGNIRGFRPFSAEITQFAPYPDFWREPLGHLQDSRLGAIPVPFVCPVSGGGIQFEWTSSKKHLEIEFMDASTAAYLTEEQTPQGELTESGEFSAADAEFTRLLLDWFAAV